MASKKAFLDTLMRYPTGWVGGEAAEALTGRSARLWRPHIR